MPHRERTTAGTVDFLYPTEGGDDTKSGIDYLLEGFREAHPEVAVDLEMVSADVAGLETKSRILQGNPPDVWMEWPGQNVRPYVDADLLLDISDVFERTGMERGYLEGPKRAVRFDGAYHAVPVTLHRANDLFYNHRVVEAAGVDPAGARSPREFLDVLEAVDAETEADPLALPMQNPWPALQLWEAILLGEHGLDTYRDVTEGRARANAEAIADALELLDAYAAYAPDDALYQSLMDAAYGFIDGETALYPQGDWMAGILEGEGMAHGDEWGHAAVPGTEDCYTIVMDALMATGATDAPEDVRTLLEYAGTPEAQQLFNETKGSIPPRGDVSMDAFSPFLQDQQRDFTRSADQPFSIAHGLGVRPQQLVELKSAVATFLTDRDTRATADAFVTIFDE